MEELLKKFLKGTLNTAVQAGITSLVTDVDFEDALKGQVAINLAGAALGGDSPLDIFKPKQPAAQPTGQQVTSAPLDPAAQGLQDRLMKAVQTQGERRGLLPAGSAKESSVGFSSPFSQQNAAQLGKSALTPIQPADTRGILESLGDVVSGDGGRGNALKQLFMPDPEGKPDPFRKYAPGLLGLIAAGYAGGAFDPVEQQQVQQYGGLTGGKLLRQNPGGYRIGIPSIARGYAGGGDIDPSTFPRRTGGISGPGTGTSDDIPAMLSDGEFVMTAKAVEGMGNGSREQGIRNMYQMMNGLESRMA